MWPFSQSPAFFKNLSYRELKRQIGFVFVYFFFSIVGPSRASFNLSPTSLNLIKCRFFQKHLTGEVEWQAFSKIGLLNTMRVCDLQPELIIHRAPQQLPMHTKIGKKKCFNLTVIPLGASHENTGLNVTTQTLRSSTFFDHRFAHSTSIPFHKRRNLQDVSQHLLLHPPSSSVHFVNSLSQK